MRAFDRAGERPELHPEPPDADAWPVQRPSASSSSSTGESFESVFLRHWHVVYAVLFRLVGSREEAEDLAQEVFFRLYKKPLPATSTTNVGGWLYRVATNLGYNSLRGRRRRDARELRVAPDAPARGTPLEQVLVLEATAEVRRALADLPNRQQACLVLRHQGFSYAEIAESLGVNPSSVGTILVRAEAEFRRRYLERRGGL
jgi:RNA polymerase sigma-70 factor (ECF subfamily)